MEDKINKTLLSELEKCNKNNEVPVAAVIVKNNKIISKAHNTRQKKHNVLYHAEIIAINKASRKTKDWRLDDCDLYVTLEPCNMCKEVIKQSRIKNVYYYNKTTFKEIKSYTNFSEISNNLSTKFLNKLREYFVSKR